MRRVVSGRFELGVSPAEAIAYFTPEGEREWVPGWDPVYPTGEPSESAGTVFTTNVGGVDTIWLIQRIDRDECSASYVRVTPGHHAGTVQVRCTEGVEEGCRVAVTYDLSLLPGGDPSEMDAYDEAPFATTMTEWANAVRQRLGL